MTVQLVASSIVTAGATGFVPGPAITYTAGDLQIQMVQVAGTITVTAPAGEGWVELHHATTPRHLHVFYRFLNGGDPNSGFTFSAASTTNVAKVILRGVDPAQPFDAGPVGDAGNSSTLSAGSVTTATPDAWLLTYMVQVQATSATTGTLTLPSGMTAGNFSTGHAANSYVGRWDYEPRATAGATGTRTSTADKSGEWQTVAFAVRALVIVGALSGSGTLAAAPSPAVARTAALSGSGTLAAGSAPAVARSAALGGSGTLTAATTPAVVRASALSGSGTLSGDIFGFVKAGLSGSGQLTAGQVVAAARAAALSGSGTLSATQRLAVSRVAALSGAGALTAATVLAVARTAALSGSGTLLAVVVYRISAWNGTRWVPVTTRVWTGWAWQDVLVTVTDN